MKRGIKRRWLASHRRLAKRIRFDRAIFLAMRMDRLEELLTHPSPALSIVKRTKLGEPWNEACNHEMQS